MAHPSVASFFATSAAPSASFHPVQPRPGFPAGPQLAPSGMPGFTTAFTSSSAAPASAGPTLPLGGLSSNTPGGASGVPNGHPAAMPASSSSTAHQMFAGPASTPMQARSAPADAFATQQSAHPTPFSAPAAAPRPAFTGPGSSVGSLPPGAAIGAPVNSGLSGGLMLAPTMSSLARGPLSTPSVVAGLPANQFPSQLPGFQASVVPALAPNSSPPFQSASSSTAPVASFPGAGNLQSSQTGIGPGTAAAPRPVGFPSTGAGPLPPAVPSIVARPPFVGGHAIAAIGNLPSTSDFKPGFPVLPAQPMGSLQATVPAAPPALLNGVPTLPLGPRGPVTVAPAAPVPTLGTSIGGPAAMPTGNVRPPFLPGHNGPPPLPGVVSTSLSSFVGGPGSVPMQPPIAGAAPFSAGPRSGLSGSPAVGLPPSTAFTSPFGGQPAVPQGPPVAGPQLSWPGQGAPQSGALPRGGPPIPGGAPPMSSGPPGPGMAGSYPTPPTGMGPPPMHAAPPTGFSSTPSAYSGPVSSSAYSQPTMGVPPPQPQASLARSSAPAPRIDPNAIPRPRYTMPLRSVPYKTTGEGFNVPPASWSDYIAEDTGNVNPRFVRCTMGHVPITKDVLKESKIPLAVVVNAIARPGYGEHEVAFSADPEGPVRCGRCRGYMNPFVRWEEGGDSWVCNLCSASNETPEYYRFPIDQYGLRSDRDRRPELSQSSVEFVAPRAFCVRNPAPLCVMFMVEATLTSVSSGAFAAALKAVEAALSQLLEYGDGVARAGIAVFDSSLHFFDMSLAEPRHTLVMDIDDAFSPLAPSQCLPALSNAKQGWQVLLAKLPEMFTPSARTAVQGCFGSAVKAGVDALAETGGRLVVFQSTIPQQGEGKLGNRERFAAYGSDDERVLYTPVAGHASSLFYSDLAKHAAAKGVCVIHNVLTSSNVDLPTSAVLASLTGGEVRLYPYFTFQPSALPAAPVGGPPKPGAPLPAKPMEGAQLSSVTPVPADVQEKISQEIASLFTGEVGTEAVLKLRTSNGLRVQRFLGNYCDRADTEADLGGLDSEKSLIAVLQHDGNTIKEGEDLHVQVALLFTTALGDRRIRVHNLRLVGTDNLQAVFRHADIDSIVAFMVREGVEMAQKKDVRAVASAMNENTIEMLHSYRRNCAPNSSPGQLILPESLKLLPLYVAALGKLPAFACNRQPSKEGAARSPADVIVRSDARIADLISVNSMPPHRLIPYFYPRLYMVHKTTPLHGVPVDSDDDITASTQPQVEFRPALDPAGLSFDDLQRVLLPPSTYPSIGQVQTFGEYLLEHATGLYLWIGPEAEPADVKGMFGSQYGDAMDLPANMSLPRLHEDVSFRLWAMIDAIRSRRSPYLPVVVVTPADTIRRDTFQKLLVEDKVGASESYVDVLCEMHKSIQTRLTS